MVYVCKSEAAKKRSDVSESDFKKRNDAFFARGGINEIIFCARLLLRRGRVDDDDDRREGGRRLKLEPRREVYPMTN